MRMCTMVLLPLVIGCAPDEKQTDLGADIDEISDEGELEPEPDPGEFESCAAMWRLAEAAPEGTGIALDAGDTIYGRFVDGPNKTEVEACGGQFEVQFAIDAHGDPAVTDWEHLPAAVEWTWEGDRSWRLDVTPGPSLAVGAHYAVEVVLRMDDELPYGMIWTWQTE